MGFLATAQSAKILSKIATNGGHGEDSAYFDGWKAYDRDPFHPIHNPSGVIQMGLAENQLCVDLIEEWIRKNPSSSICTAQGVSSFRDMAIFQDYHGLPDFRKAVARFMERVRRGKTKFDPNRIIMSGGATGAHELIAFCLADPGDAFLVPTPYYPGFDRDLRWRTGVELIPIVCESSNQFKITKPALDDAYNNAQKANIRVKGVLITNPSNPLGTLLDRETLTNLLSFTNAKNIHLVCDEIYGATVFKKPNFISISEVIEEEANHLKCNKDLIHIVYSLSKDLGLPGFRVGIIYSYNDNVVNCGRKMSSFGLVSAQTQYLIASMLMDDEFVGKFLEESAMRLRRRYECFIEGLGKEGISCLESNAGLFCWMDLRQLLEEVTKVAEMDLWQTIIHDVKLNVSPGSSFHCSEPGWFRVCFASMEEETMEVALDRISCFMRKTSMSRKKKKKKMTKRKAMRKDQLCISFPLSVRGGFEEFMSISPHAMSPHSPLVHAPTSG